MLLLVKEKINEEDLKKAAEDLDGYVKFVVDIRLRVMTVGGLRHVEGEELLLKEGSRQEDLWGGGFDLETKEVDFDSMINIRPNQNNPSREVLAQEIREKMVEILKRLIL